MPGLGTMVAGESDEATPAPRATPYHPSRRVRVRFDPRWGGHRTPSQPPPSVQPPANTARRANRVFSLSRLGWYLDPGREAAGRSDPVREVARVDAGAGGGEKKSAVPLPIGGRAVVAAGRTAFYARLCDRVLVTDEAYANALYKDSRKGHPSIPPSRRQDPDPGRSVR